MPHLVEFEGHSDDVVSWRVASLEGPEGTTVETEVAT